MRWHLYLALGLAAGLAACDRGDDRIRAQAISAAPVAQSDLPALPPPPAWSAGLDGKPFSAAFTDATGRCESAVDGVRGRFKGGVMLLGWGWDPAARSVVERVVLVDGAGLMVGFADGHGERKDVSKNRPDIPADDTGWTAYLPTPKGEIVAYGLLKDGKACPMGPAPAA